MNLTSLLAKLSDLDKLWNPEEAAASLAAYRALIPAVEQLTGTDRCYLIELHALIARSEAVAGHFTEARAALAQAGRLIEEQTAAIRVSARIRWLLEIARVHILEKTPSQTRRPLSEAWTLAINSGEDDLAVETAQLIASTEPPKAQQDWIIRGIDLAEQSPLPKAKRWLGSLYASLGWKLYDVRQFENALDVFQRALRHFKATGTNREVFVAKWSTGKVLRAMGKTEEALTIQNALLAELGIGGARDGLLYEEIAECLQTLKRAPEAQLYFELAYNELSLDAATLENQPIRMKRLKDLGKVK